MEKDKSSHRLSQLFPRYGQGQEELFTVFSLESSPFICWVLLSQVEAVQWKEAFGDYQREKTKQAKLTRGPAGIKQELLCCPVPHGLGLGTMPSSLQAGRQESRGQEQLL